MYVVLLLECLGAERLGWRESYLSLTAEKNPSALLSTVAGYRIIYAVPVQRGGG